MTRLTTWLKAKCHTKSLKCEHESPPQQLTTETSHPRPPTPDPYFVWDVGIEDPFTTEPIHSLNPEIIIPTTKNLPKPTLVKMTTRLRRSSTRDLPASFLSLPSELRQQVFSYTFQLIRPWVPQTSRWMSQWIRNRGELRVWMGRLKDVHQDLVDDVEYVEDIWAANLVEMMEKAIQDEAKFMTDGILAKWKGSLLK